MHDPHPDAVDRMLTAALEVYANHEPGPDRNCVLPGCRARRPTGPCLPYETADTVLNLWAGEDYVSIKPSGKERKSRLHA